jgi:hypothetical protein
MTYRASGVGVSSDILAGKVAQTAFERFSRVGSSTRSDGRGRLLLF